MRNDPVSEASERLALELGAVEVYDGDRSRCPLCAPSKTEAA